MLFDTSAVTTHVLENSLLAQKQVKLSILRLDKVHPVVSGNKLFKLHFFLKEALTTTHKTMLSFGGPYSNHLAATAYACKAAGLKSIGIIRGEEPKIISHTLQQIINYGMRLKFISREEFDWKERKALSQSLQNEFGECLIVPEGGYHPLGAKGASLIMNLITVKEYSHICTAVGSATTLAGLLMAAKKEQKFIGIPSLKGMVDTGERINFLTGLHTNARDLLLLDEFHFGGYAKKTPALIQFMNDCWHQFQLPLDFVYTAKMLYAVIESVKAGIFPPGSSIICLHTGGLQGNKSLPAGSLLFT